MSHRVQRAIHSLTRGEIAAACAEMGEPAYRAKQIWQWLYRKLAGGWDQMTNLPSGFRAALAERFSLAAAVPVATEGKSAGTRKILVALRDGERIEEVLIPARDRKTVCVSSQAGCRFNCAFCASGKAGFRRNLEAGEMVGQVLLAAGQYGERPTHVVYMGIGEPFDNYDEVLKSIRILNDPDGLGIGARRITISTCGVIPGIQRLAGEDLQVELSVSLHASEDGLRSRLMPVNRKYPLAALIKACDEYTRQTGRIITFEYALIGKVNDSRSHAEALARLLAPLQCRVNLIPLSPVCEYEGRPPSRAAADVFIERLARGHINATLRASKGCDLNAACGQLRLRSEAGGKGEGRKAKGEGRAKGGAESE